MFTDWFNDVGKRWNIFCRKHTTQFSQDSIAHQLPLLESFHVCLEIVTVNLDASSFHVAKNLHITVGVILVQAAVPTRQSRVTCVVLCQVTVGECV
jgi:hypothetical protein